MYERKIQSAVLLGFIDSVAKGVITNMLVAVLCVACLHPMHSLLISKSTHTHTHILISVAMRKAVGDKRMYF